MDMKDRLNITKDFDEVCQDIMNKRNTEYCGAYELMKHDKIKHECFKTTKMKLNMVSSEASSKRTVGKCLSNI